jgi:(p)ppGpp synthase/HD superfamily hydrolase
VSLNRSGSPELSQANRVETMAEKLAVYATRAGVPDVDLITDAYHIAMRPRLQTLPDVFHFDMLHPARTALILLENIACRDATVLAAAQLIETRDAGLRVSENIASALGDDVATLVVAVPTPQSAIDDDELREALVTADRDAALIAVAERLDHARHLHMRERSEWDAYFAQTVDVYVPVAARLNEDLARRFERWAQSFARRVA